MILSNQQLLLAKYLLKHRAITPLECFKYLGFMRPDRRVGELRAMFGWDVIKTEMVKRRNKQHARYVLNRKYVTKLRKAVKK